MAIDFSQVKTIMIPEGSVTKITDSTGAVLWVNEADFPYRRLQYIESNGRAALDTQANCAKNSFMRLTIEDMSNGAGVQGNGRDNPDDNNARFFVGYDGGNYWLGLGSSTKQAGIATPGQHTLELYGPGCQNGSGYKIDGT